MARRFNPPPLRQNSGWTRKILTWGFPNSRCLGVPRTSITTLFCCIWEILILRILGTSTPVCPTIVWQSLVDMINWGPLNSLGPVQWLLFPHLWQIPGSEQSLKQCCKNLSMSIEYVIVTTSKYVLRFSCYIEWYHRFLPLYPRTPISVSPSGYVAEPP